MIQSIKVESAPVSRVRSVKSPATVLFQRGVVKASVSARGEVEGSSVRGSRQHGCDVGNQSAEDKPISSGCCTETVMPCVSSVGSVSVKREVASLLRPVASASPSILPREKLAGLLQRSRRAAAAQKFERLQLRLADKTLSVVSQLPRVASGRVALSGVVSEPVASVSTVACVSSSGPVVASVGFVALQNVRRSNDQIASVMSKVASGASVASCELVASASVQSVASQSVASQSVASSSVASVPVVSASRDVGEWRQVGDALSSVLSRVRVLAEASAKVSSVDGNDRSRMH